MMYSEKILTKKDLEEIIKKLFIKFGSHRLVEILDALKLLGFTYATKGGISISIEDLKTPILKKTIFNNLEKELFEINSKWNLGYISELERFQNILDHWSSLSDFLKTEIIKFYKQFDPFNNLFIMAFSGARGNISQVHQLIGLRGLMSDQHGNVIDTPINKNFREGLSPMDYFISSYGARKGIVDTALKTADSGYLTRRLVYLTQNIIIREFNCKTNSGVLIQLHPFTSIQNLIGLVIKDIYVKNNFLITGVLSSFREKIFTKNLGLLLKKVNNVSLKINSVITCKSLDSICQQCYGYNLNNNNLIQLGDVVGLIAAQSIGEPGTQLTMRTFHTGGVFRGSKDTKVLSPFSGKVYYPKNFKKVIRRSVYGEKCSLLTNNTRFSIILWNGVEKFFDVPKNTLIFFEDNTFVKKNSIIGTAYSKTDETIKLNLKLLEAPFSGIIFHKHFKYEYFAGKHPIFRKNVFLKDQGNLDIFLCSKLLIPMESKLNFFFSTKLEQKANILGTVKIISPISGYITTNKSFKYIELTNDSKKFKIQVPQFNCYKMDGFEVDYIYKVQNFQYVDKYSCLIEIIFKYNKRSEHLYSFNNESFNNKKVYFFYKQDNFWKFIPEDLIRKTSLNHQKFTNSRSFLTNTIKSCFNGCVDSDISKSGKLFFQKYYSIFFNKPTLFPISLKKKTFIEKAALLGYTTVTTKQTEDIVQGLPKVERLLEARFDKNDLELYSHLPGIVLKDLDLQRIKIEFRAYQYIKFSLYNKKYSHLTIKDVHRNHIEKPLNITGILTSLRQLNKFNTLYTNDSIWILKNKVSKKMAQVLFINADDILAIDKRIFNSTSKDFFVSIKNIFLVKKGRNRNILLILKESSEIFLYKKITIVFPILKDLPKNGSFIDVGELLNVISRNPHLVLKNIDRFHEHKFIRSKSLPYTVKQFQLILLNSLQAIYYSQGIYIANKHLEIVVRQLMSKCIIKEPGDTPFILGESIKYDLIIQLLELFEKNKYYSCPQIIPKFSSITDIALSQDGFLTPASFQETRQILTNATIEGKRDWLRNLKENIMLGRNFPAGSSFLNYKNFLDNIYRFN